MTAIGLELCDVNVQAALSDGNAAVRPLVVPGGSTALLGWPAFIARDGNTFMYGRAAEDIWHIHPRKVCHNFLAHLSREASPLALDGKFLSYSQLGYFFLRDYGQQAFAGTPEKLVLAVPGTFLKDAATEDEKVGLLLGMARELKWPLAGVVDMACAALCDPSLPGVHASWPIVVLDIHLDGAELTLFQTDRQLERTDFLLLPQSGFAQLLKQAVTAMGNRFLRHTAFDILADGRLEQAFYGQVKDFAFGSLPEFHFQINTAKRAYEMTATRELLLADAQPFVAALATAVTTLLRKHAIDVHACTLALTARASAVPGLETRFHQSGLHHLLRLPRGAAAQGAARLAADLPVPADVSDVPVLTRVAPEQANLRRGAVWEMRLQRATIPSPRQVPTHVIIDGIGHPLLGNGTVKIGSPSLPNVDVALPAPFKATPDCLVLLVRDSGRLWLNEAGANDTGTVFLDTSGRLPVEAGDRMVVRVGDISTELLFAACRPGRASQQYS
jgi:hypothetical protein